jgi:SAM-dependent methyltransferase
MNSYIEKIRRQIEFKSDFIRFSAQLRHANLPKMDWRERYPCLDEKTPKMGYEPHYTYHCAWACRVLVSTSPRFHVDISSSLQFAAMASAWVPVHHMDFRRPDIVLSGLKTSTGSLLNLPLQSNSVASLSCMHVVEHVGLGRYGDPLNVWGDQQAANELSRVLAPGGNLLIVVPLGRPRINFNAHRVYSYEQALGLFSELQLKQFALIPDNFESGMIVDARPDVVNSQEWGCGCFVLTKVAT